MTNETPDARPASSPRPRRRVTTAPPAGTDPDPGRVSHGAEPERHRGDENDDRLRADKPPHYG